MVTSVQMKPSFVQPCHETSKSEIIIGLSSAIPCQTASQPGSVPHPHEPLKACCGWAACVLFSCEKMYCMIIDPLGLAFARGTVGGNPTRLADFKHCCIFLRNLNRMRMHAKLYFGCCSNKSQHARLKTVEMLVQMKPSFVQPCHETSKNEIIIRLSSAIPCQTV